MSTHTEGCYFLFCKSAGVGMGKTSPTGNNRKLFYLLRWKHFWWAALLAIGPVLAFYLLREAYNPGYIAAVMQNEVAVVTSRCRTAISIPDTITSSGCGGNNSSPGCFFFP